MIGVGLVNVWSLDDWLAAAIFCWSWPFNVYMEWFFWESFPRSYDIEKDITLTNDRSWPSKCLKSRRLASSGHFRPDPPLQPHTAHPRKATPRLLLTKALQSTWSYCHVESRSYFTAQPSWTHQEAAFKSFVMSKPLSSLLIWLVALITIW